MAEHAQAFNDKPVTTEQLAINYSSLVRSLGFLTQGSVHGSPNSNKPGREIRYKSTA